MSISRDCKTNCKNEIERWKREKPESFILNTSVRHFAISHLQLFNADVFSISNSHKCFSHRFQPLILPFLVMADGWWCSLCRLCWIFIFVSIDKFEMNSLHQTSNTLHIDRIELCQSKYSKIVCLIETWIYTFRLKRSDQIDYTVKCKR